MQHAVVVVARCDLLPTDSHRLCAGGNPQRNLLGEHRRQRSDYILLQQAHAALLANVTLDKPMHFVYLSQTIGRTY